MSKCSSSEWCSHPATMLCVDKMQSTHLQLTLAHPSTLQSHDMLAFQRSPTPPLPPHDRFRSPSDGAHGYSRPASANPAGAAQRPTAFEQGWIEGARQSAEFRAATPPPPQQPLQGTSQADYAGFISRAGLGGGWLLPAAPPQLPPLGECPTMMEAPAPQGMDVDACPPWGGHQFGQPPRHPSSQAHQQHPVQQPAQHQVPHLRQASWQQLPGCASAGVAEMAEFTVRCLNDQDGRRVIGVAGAIDEAPRFVSMTL